jgi:hypothetical protein
MTDALEEHLKEHLKEHIEVYLSCLTFPEHHRRRIHVTNGP